MSNPLLATKLYIPVPRTDSVSRPRLVEQLHQGAQHKLTLISAPPGFGKTSLLSEWITQREQPVAWVSLDTADNDPVRFWSYCVAALETLQASIGEQVLPMLQSPQPPPMESVLTALINAFTDSLRSHDPTHRSYTLVLDDYHVIETHTIHEALTFLLDHLPPPLHLVITCRADPPLPLARLRARGELIELRAADLRFTLNEAVVFLNHMMGLNLSTRDVSALSERTEGWVAGLQLAALSMQGRDTERITEFIQAFSGSHHYIMDYLTEEVLGRQPENVQHFLLQTSILNRLSGSLCDALTAQSDGQVILEQLERSNLFIVPLEEERRWYRYHHLFADLLRYRLQQSQPDLVPELHRRASIWYEGNGFTSEAIQHTLAANDFERAARLVEQIGEATWMHGQVRTLLGWLDALPDMVVRTHARLCLFYAWMYVLEGQVEPAQRRLQDAEKVAEQTSAEEQGMLFAIGAAIAYLRGDFSRSIEQSQQALQRLPADDAIWRGVTTINLGIAYRLGGDIRAAAQNFAEAVRMNRAADNWHATLLALVDLGDTYQLQGQLQRAAELYQEVLDSAAERGARRLPLMVEPHVRMGRLWYEWNDLEAATTHLTEGIELSQQLENMLTLGYLGLARVLQARGDVPGALAFMQKAETLARSHNTTVRTAADVQSTRARLWWAQGNVTAATDWAHEFGLRVEGGSEKSAKSPIWYEVVQIALARVLIAQQRPAEAQRLLTHLRRAAEAGRRIEHMVEMLALQSLALRAQGKTAEALAALERALTLAEPGGYVRMFVDDGEPMKFLILDFKFQIDEQRRDTGDQRAQKMLVYANKLLAAFASAVPENANKSKIINQKSEILLEPLSERELEVLRLVAAGASNREIAKELTVTVGTVKAHIHNIYGKLNVQSRTQAIARARELKLI